QSFEPISARHLVTSYEQGQAQAVLLRAVKVIATVSSTSARATRALFRRLKFLQLLHTIEPVPSGHRITIDGPLSLFESTGKYGLRLALVLSALEACGQWTLEAHVRWGKDRVPLVFRCDGGQSENGSPTDPPMPEEIDALVRAFDRLGTDWTVRPCSAILELEGTGLCIPDLVFERADVKIYFELLGYWSRDAVFRRVELVERGLSKPILFAASARLRVSEQLLDEKQ